MPNLKRSWAVWFLALAALFVGGCINYEESVELNKNGSGKMIMHYSMAQQLVAMMSMGGEQGGGGQDQTKDMPFKLKEDEVKADLKANGITFEKFETKTEGDQQHFYVHLSFDKITSLNQTKTFKEMPFEWVEADGKIVFKQTLKGKKKEGDQAAAGQDDEMAKNMAKAMFGNAAFNFKVKLPAKALPSPDTNGTIAEDGQTVNWTWPLADLGEQDKVMTASFKAGGFPFSIGVIALIAVAALLSIVGLAVVIMFARKK